MKTSVHIFSSGQLERQKNTLPFTSEKGKRLKLAQTFVLKED